jgi:hypothetical protein
MSFSNPFFLFGLFAILIPVIIHLFNFRRYKTAYFSNVKMLQDILQKTKKESQLQHLIVLVLRIFGIAALVFAFAQPYIPNKSNDNNSANLVSVFLDNSFSMDANSNEGALLYDAINAAKNVVNAFSYADDFILVTQDFKAKESHILNKDEILSLLDEIQISPESKSLKDIVAFEENTASYSIKKNRIHYYISDFQKNNIDFSALPNSDNNRSFLIPIPVQQTNNIAIDSCWFNSPIFKIGQQVSLTVRVHNYGTTDIQKLPIKLFINDRQKSIAAFDIKAESYSDYQMNFTITTSGIQQCYLQIEDAPITFDDRLYFVFEVTESTPVIAIVENNDNRYLNAIYGKDSLFVYSVMNVNQVNFSKFSTTELIVLNELKTISSGLADELKKFVVSGGNLLVFPNEAMEQPGWQSFLDNLGCAHYKSLVETPLKVGKINTESIYFKGSFSEAPVNVNMPLVSKYFELSQNQTNPAEKIMLLENNAPLLSCYQLEKGKIFLSAVALNDNFGDAHKHALFFVPLLNIGILGQTQTKLYNIIGKDEFQTIADKSSNAEELFTLKNKNSGNELIPEQRTIGNQTVLYFHSPISTPGFFDVSKANLYITSIAFNLDRGESNLNYYSKNELEKFSNDSKHPFEVIDGSTKDLTKHIADSLNGIQLWRYFVILALICFLGEILILRFWGRAKIRER